MEKKWKPQYKDDQIVVSMFWDKFWQDEVLVKIKRHRELVKVTGNVVI